MTRFCPAVVLAAVAFAAVADAQAVRVSGYVRRADSREVIRYATVAADADSVRVQSNADGFYFLPLEPGRHRIVARAFGYAPLDTTIDIASSATIELLLRPIAATLSEVRVVEQRDVADVDPETPDMSISRLDMPTIRQTPAVLGEVDPIRSLTLLPGVSRSTDFSTAFSVRGGASDQNLILLDEATIYNPAHVLGFLSVFNADAVDDITLYKGAIPARYGGRLSSVVDVRQREGNANEFAGAASVGILASRLIVEGPLPAAKGSFLVAGRRSYADLFLRLSNDTSINTATAYFYDLNAKTNFKTGPNSTLMLSGYMGRDAFSPSDQFGADWGNVSGTLRWNHVAGNRLLSKVTLFGSDYDYGLVFGLLGADVKWTSLIQSRALRIDETLYLGESHALAFGLETALETIRPGDIQTSDAARVEPVHIQPRRGLTAALYVGHEVEIGDRLAVRYGGRVSSFRRRGASTIYLYPDDAPVVWNTELLRYEPVRPSDSVHYGAGEVISRFTAFEPRASARWSLSRSSSIKASYAHTAQYLMLASRTNAPTPLDVWEPVGPYVRPERADQYALGWAGFVRDGTYEVSAEVYIKSMRNVIDFIDGTDVILNPRLETAIIQGVGRARGLELFVRKTRGAFTGWTSYTLGHSEQRFSPGPGQGINEGRWYTSPSSKTHDLSIVALRRLSTRWMLGSTFTASSGLPTTYPTSRYNIDGRTVAEFGPRNAQRLPWYHRLDVALTRTAGRGELHLGIFNMYNRFNAQSLSFRQSAENPLVTEAVQTAVFRAVPSISYTRRF